MPISAAAAAADSSGGDLLNDLLNLGNSIATSECDALRVRSHPDSTSSGSGIGVQHHAACITQHAGAKRTPLQAGTAQCPRLERR